MKVAISGISGLLGSNFSRELVRRGYDVLGLTTAHSTLIKTNKTEVYNFDYKSYHKLKNVLRKSGVSVFVHCAAITNLSQCEQGPQLANEINVEITRKLKLLCSALNIHFIFISTDSVYKESNNPINESGPLKPLNVYAKTKLAAESHLGAEDLILRVNFFGRNIVKSSTSSLYEWVSQSLSNGDKINGFTDVYFSPLNVVTLSEKIIKSIEAKITGVYNVGSANGISKYEFCKCVCEVCSYDTALVEMGSIETQESVVKRPFKIILDASRFEHDLKLNLPTVQEEIIKQYQWDHQLSLKEELCN